MADAVPSPNAPLTEEAFMADRQRFFHQFTSFATGSTIALIVLLVLMAIFLL